jgi:hypothetical protein
MMLFLDFTWLSGWKENRGACYGVLSAFAMSFPFGCDPERFSSIGTNGPAAPRAGGTLGECISYRTTLALLS